MRMDKVFDSMDQSTFLRIIDDILLQGTSEEEVISLLDKVLALCKKHNIVVSLQKFEIGCELGFCGYWIKYNKDSDTVTIQPDPHQISVLKQFSTPRTKKQLESFLGLALYLSKWTNKFTFSCPHLREL